jgi:FkbM family methyltransferase
MSCKYFILSKPLNNTIDDNTNQIIFLNSKSYILPQNNINYYMNNGLFEKHLIDWSKQYCSKDKNMIDIGAHSGTYSISLADNCKEVYSFEPQKMTYYSLCGSVALSNITNITCINVGLGSEKQVGINTLNIVSLDGVGSTLHNNNNILRTEQIEIKTLDSYNIENIGFIKIDVEENELDVLKGSLITLQKSNYPNILFESNIINEPLFNFVRNLNYKIIQINGYKNMYLAVYKNN